MLNKMNEVGFRTAVQSFLLQLGFDIDMRMHSFPGIDCTLVCVGDDPVLIVTSNSQSDYSIEETENTRKILRRRDLIAV